MILAFPATKKSGSKGDVWSIDTRAGIAWIVAQALGEQGDVAGPLDERTERARLLHAQANLAELTEAERRGELLPAEEVLEGWQSAVSRARSLLLGIPSAVSDQIVSIARRQVSDTAAATAVREQLAEFVTDALAELARTEPDDDEERNAAA